MLSGCGIEGRKLLHFLAMTLGTRRIAPGTPNSGPELLTRINSKRPGKWSRLLGYKKEGSLVSSDLTELLAYLNRHRVKYVIVGGYAVMKYTEPRYTKDVDLLVEASTSNSKKLVSALKAFGAPVDNLSPTEFAEAGAMYYM